MKEFTEDGYEIEADGFYTFPRDLTPPRTTETPGTPTHHPTTPTHRG